MGIKDKNIYDKIKRNNPYFEDFITRSVYHSNAIEGNTLSYAETYSIIFNQNDMQITATSREIYEAINLKYALNYVLQNLDQDMTPDFIKHIGVLINRNINEIDGFRQGAVFIRGAEHIPPEASYVPSLISQILYEYRNDDREIHEKIADFHIKYERIHPFSDGNGRSGRVLVEKELLKEGYAPIVVPLEERNQYMDLLAKQDVTGLSSFFERLSNIEEERMEKFGIKLED